MLNPEVVIAAMEKSQRLNALNRRMCRPLDRVVGSPADAISVPVSDVDLDEGDDESVGSDADLRSV
ncbi:MAG: hypothetical protein H7Z19_18290 [Chitinophagaceae bacterium]|nr:hypothetical protein [Rubrivivax sp.]